MKKFKKCKVVALDTKITPGVIPYFKNIKFPSNPFIPLNNEECTYKLLYVLSDDEIKKGDWVLEVNRGRVGKVIRSEVRDDGCWECKIKTGECEYYPVNIVKKIIASTDSSLGIPLLDAGFIKHYIESDGFPAVLIEYDTQERCASPLNYEDDIIVENNYIVAVIGRYDDFELKEWVTSKSGFISYKFIKDSFEKKDIPIKAIKDCLRYCEDQQIYDKLSKYGDFYYKLNGFIKNNC